MNVKIAPKILNGVINAPASKSEAHRILICAALSDKKTKIYNLDKNNLNDDINATVNCLEALGAGFEFKDNYVIVRPINKILASDKPHVLNCNESGSTLRFMLPVACALYDQVEFTGKGRLPERPLDDLLSVMKSHGVSFSSDKLPFVTHGRLNAGEFKIRGDVSSQYITGLLLAMPLLNDNSKIILTSSLKSADYVNITLKVLRDFNIEVKASDNSYETAHKGFNSPEVISVGADWSSAAFYLAAGTLGCDVSLSGLDVNSAQGDKKILELLKDFGADVYINEDKIAVNKNKLIAQQIDIDATPDLLPVLAVIAAYAQGETVFYNAARLRLKESDRIKSACEMINALGGQAEERPDALIVRGSNFNKLTGGFVNGCNDHRIVMAAAIAAVNCNNEVVISDCEAVSKSYVNFFEDYKRLGGILSVV
ncbi:MAG: 3-phosphoshikimate 1-carboxyvinyltransferase [Synergistaceae bacterium]|nr:3-phosphoshikimate 1-carboxyvinyltransferase [Synergistaceae bacterium]